MNNPTAAIAESDAKEPATKVPDLLPQPEDAARESHSGQPATSAASAVGSGSVSPKQPEIIVQPPEDSAGKGDDGKPPVTKGIFPAKWRRLSTSMRANTASQELAFDTSQGDDTERVGGKRRDKKQHPEQATEDREGEKSSKAKAKVTTSKADLNDKNKDSSKPGPVHLQLVLLSPGSSAPTNVDIVAVHDINQPIETAWTWAGIPDKDATASAIIPTKQMRDVKEHGNRERSNSRRRRSGEKDPQGRDKNTPTLPTQSEHEVRQTTTAAWEAARNEAERQTTALDVKGKGKSTEDMVTSMLAPPEPTSEQTSAGKEPGQHPPMQSSDRGKKPDYRPDDSTQPSGRPRSSMGSRGPSLKAAKPTNWLRDLTKLGGQIGRPRVMAFGYAPDAAAPTLPPNDDVRFDQPLEQLSLTLISRLVERRKENSKPVPLVFIGTGVGCLIIQEVIRLTAESEEKYPERHSLLDMTAGILFLNAPAPIPKKQPKEELRKEGTKAEEPKKESGVPRTVFPPAANTHGRWGNALFRPQDVDSGELWEKFQSTIKSKPLYVVWFYDPSPKADQDKKFYADRVVFVRFTNAAANSARSSPPKAQGPKDDNYRKAVAEIRGSLLFKASEEKKLEELLEELIRGSNELTLAVRDVQGSCPIHRAASVVNVHAVDLLVDKDNSLALSQDKDGRTPLHVVVSKATRANPQGNEQTAFRRIIEKFLTAFTTLKAFIDPEDGNGNTPWDYFDTGNGNYRWIAELKNEFSLIAMTTYDREPRQLAPPDRDQAMKLEACKKSKATLAQFFLNKDGNTDYVDRQQCSVFEVVYENGYYAPETLFSRKLRLHPDRNPTCRWIHLPANNEEWVQDLFLQLKRVDTSLSERRHQGAAKYDRHMISDAQKCKQTYQSLPESHGPPSSSGSTSIGSEGAAREFEVYNLVMPILGFEKHQYRRKLSEMVETEPDCHSAASDETTLLIGGYFAEQEFPLHCRRTLDQFTYHMLKDTDKRDNTQVMFKWAKEQDQLEQDQLERKQVQPKRRRSGRKAQDAQSRAEDDYPILMVDQLWLWVLKDAKTVVTFFPNTWESNSAFNLVRHCWEKHFKKNHNRQVITSAMDLANEIIRCSIDFMRRSGPKNMSLQECFQSSISAIAESQARQFEHFEDVVNQLRFYKGLVREERDELTDQLFRQNEETSLLVKILDIQDELKIIKDVFAEQKEALDKFHQLVVAEEQKKPSSPSGPRVHFDDEPPSKSSQLAEGKSSQLATNNSSLVDSNILAVEEMMKYADKLSVELTKLLDLKQKQANAWEARFSREGSQASQRQGNITMVFTLVTIFFLPLSFISSVFTIGFEASPRDSTGETAWPIRTVMGLIFGVSFAVSIPLAIVAFRVNQITARIASWFGSSSTTNNDDEEDDDSDSDSDSDNGSNSDSDSDSDGTTASNHSSLDDGPYSAWYTSEYAPLFGRWNFHQKIPLLRWFWRCRYWSSNGWSSGERPDIDYPLHHALHVMEWIVFRCVRGLLGLTGPRRLQRWVSTRLMKAEWERMMRVFRAMKIVEERQGRDGSVLSLDDTGRGDIAWTSARADDTNV